MVRMTMKIVRARSMIGVMLALLLGSAAGWLVGAPHVARSTSGGADSGPGDDATVLFQATDPILGTKWRLISYEDAESGWTCIDTLAFDTADLPIGGGGGCDPSYPAGLPAAGEATLATSGGVLVPGPGPKTTVWHGSAWGRVNCDGCQVLVNWAGGPKTFAAVSDDGYWISYSPLPADVEDVFVSAVTVI